MMSSFVRCDCKKMGNRSQIESVCNFRSPGLVYVVTVITILAILSQFLAIPSGNYTLIPAHVKIMFMTVSNTGLSSNKSQLANIDLIHETEYSGLDEEALYSKEEGRHKGYNSLPEDGGQVGASSEDERQLPTEFNRTEYSALREGLENEVEFTEQIKTFKANDTGGLTFDASLTEEEEVRRGVDIPSPKPLPTQLEFIPKVSDTSVPYSDDLLQPGSGLVSPNNSSVTPGKTVLKKSRRPTPISYMKTLLHQDSRSANSMVCNMQFISL